MAKKPKSELPDEAATERVSAPDTDTPEIAELKRQLAEAEHDKEEALAQLDTATQQPAVVIAPIPFQVNTPNVPTAQLPRNMQVKRTGFAGAPMTTMWPEIRGGTCEACGTLDKNTPAQYQYKLCGHYRGMQAMCTFCPAEKDPDEIIYHSNLKVATDPENPNQLIMWCNSTACSDALLKRFNGMVS